MRNPYHAPRAPHCLGCGNTFRKMHWMIDHRRSNRCGGRFLPPEERVLRLEARHHYEECRNATDPDMERYHFANARDCNRRANLLRSRRIAIKSNK